MAMLCEKNYCVIIHTHSMRSRVLARNCKIGTYESLPPINVAD